MSLKRQVANLLERLSGNVIIPPHELHLLPERLHLRRLLSYLGVDCVFDVGANAGQYATMLRKQVGYRGPIISFEPIPELAASMRERAAQDPNWHVQAMALDREAGTATFNVMRNSEFSSLRRPAEDQPETFSTSNEVIREIQVERSTVEAQIQHWQSKLGFRQPFLKMDTQGNDLAVIEGAGKSLAKFAGLQSELAILRLYDGSADFSATLTACQEKGFVISAFVPNNEGKFPVLVEVDCIMINKKFAPADIQIGPSKAH
ncbi:methyltransferase, FkbM family [Acetobacteraceae bacterium AT-5844]|nr:methyltransferase, FkbM family [Acetobacteraceae bacterium AT-5844]